MRCWLPVTSLMEMLTLQPGSHSVKLALINFMNVHSTSFRNALINFMNLHSTSFRNASTNSILVSTTRSSVERALRSLDPNSTTWTDVMEKQGCQTHTFGKLDYTPGHRSISDGVET
ncbi:Arylsulfatase K [Lemmus lemmus]